MNLEPILSKDAMILSCLYEIYLAVNFSKINEKNKNNLLKHHIELLNLLPSNLQKCGMSLFGENTVLNSDEQKIVDGIKSWSKTTETLWK